MKTMSTTVIDYNKNSIILLFWPICFTFWCSAYYIGVVVSSYVIEQGVCYLVLCEAAFPKKMAYGFLEDLQAEFQDQYGKRVSTVTRPYSFIEFGKLFCTHTKKIYLNFICLYNWNWHNISLHIRPFISNIENFK